MAWIGADGLDRHDDPSPNRAVSGSSGWISARFNNTRVFVRAGEYSSNPSHIDPAHVDVWIGGEPRAIDAGTYRYTSPAPWANGLSGISVHNTVDIPALPAAVKGMRFLWLERPRATVTRTDQSAGSVVLEINNSTWKSRGISHRRRCTLLDSSVEIEDEVDTGQRSLDVRVHWLLPADAPLPEISSPGGGQLSVVRASPTSVEGWRSTYYGARERAASVTFVITVTGRETIRTRFVATNLPRDP